MRQLYLLIAILNILPSNIEAVDINTIKPEAKVQISKDHVVIYIPLPHDTKFNFDGPWKLEVDGDINFSKGKKFKLKQEDFDKSNQSFKLAHAPGIKGKASFKLNYFICDKDAKWCKPLKFNGQISI